MNFICSIVIGLVLWIVLGYLNLVLLGFRCNLHLEKIMRQIILFFLLFLVLFLIFENCFAGLLLALIFIGHQILFFGGFSIARC